MTVRDCSRDGSGALRVGRTAWSSRLARSLEGEHRLWPRDLRAYASSLLSPVVRQGGPGALRAAAGHLYLPPCRRAG